MFFWLENYRMYMTAQRERERARTFAIRHSDENCSLRAHLLLGNFICLSQFSLNTVTSCWNVCFHTATYNFYFWYVYASFCEFSTHTLDTFFFIYFASIFICSSSWLNKMRRKEKRNKTYNSYTKYIETKWNFPQRLFFSPLLFSFSSFAY